MFLGKGGVAQPHPCGVIGVRSSVIHDEWFILYGDYNIFWYCCGHIICYHICSFLLSFMTFEEAEI